LLLRTYLLRPHVHARELAFSRKALFPSQPPGNPRAAFYFSGERCSEDFSNSILVYSQPSFLCVVVDPTCLANSYLTITI
jgi:hypothetical protein